MNIVVTGGAGFIGCNLALGFHKRGHNVSVVDNLSRPGGGSERNAQELQLAQVPLYPINVDSQALQDLIKGLRPDVIIHCAAQTTLRRVLNTPFPDFCSNAIGTLQCLEAAKAVNAHLIYFSTNKVYGSLSDLPVQEEETRYTGPSIDESYPIQPHLDPYSLSKTTGDLYCQLYPNTTILRCSSMYGPRQWSIQGQGWLGVFGLYAATGKPVVISGNGKQVRDVLHIDDIEALIERIVDRRILGVFNVGGGIDNSWSVLEYLSYLHQLHVGETNYTFAPWNPWTEKFYVSNTTKIEEAADWKPRVGKEGVEKYVKRWLLPVVLLHDLDL